MADGSIRIDSRIDAKGFNSGIKGIVGSLKGMAAMVGVAFGVGAIVKFGQTAVNEASTLASALTGLQSVLEGQGKSFGAAQQFIKQYTKDGLVPATNAIVAYKNLALRGYDDSQIQKVLIALKDSAAFGKAAQLSMGEAVQSATEGLKNENSILVDNAGVTKNVAKMWDEYAKSIGKTVDELTQAEKIQAELNGILEESKYQAGDAAKLTQTYAGQVAQLSAGFKEFMAAAGSAIIPLLMKILPYINMAIAWLTALAKTFAKVMAVLFGTQVQQAASAMDAATASTQAATAAQEDLTDQTAATGKAARGALAAFDELNVLQRDEGAGAAGAAGEPMPLPVPLTPEIIPPEDTLSPEMLSKIEEFKNRLLELLNPASEALGRLKESLLPLGETIWEGLKWAWDNILVPLGEWIITDAAPVFFDLLGASAEVLNEVLIALKPLGIWLWEEWLKPLGEWAAPILLDALKWLIERLHELADWIREHPEQVRRIFVLLNPLIILIHLLGAAWDWMKDMATKASNWIIKTWQPVADWFKNIVNTPIEKNFTETWDRVKKLAGVVWDRIQDIWKGAGDWIKDHVTEPIREAFRTALDWVQDKWQTIWGGLSDFVKNSINTVIDLINGLLNAYATGINAIIGALNSLSIDIPAWVPIFGGQQWGLSIPYVIPPQIPHLATGAVIPPNSEFLAVLGDQRSGRNLEAPEGLLRQIIQEEIGKVQADVTIRFSGNMAALVRQLKPYIDKENVRIGSSLLVGGATR